VRQTDGVAGLRRPSSDEATACSTNRGIWANADRGAAGTSKLRVIWSNPVGHAIVGSCPQGGPTYPIFYRRCSAWEQLREYRIALRFVWRHDEADGVVPRHWFQMPDPACEPGDLCHLIVFVLVLALTNGCGTVVVPVGVMLG
jgi:hypothetical protein